MVVLEVDGKWWVLGPYGLLNVRGLGEEMEMEAITRRVARSLTCSPCVLVRNRCSK